MSKAKIPTFCPPYCEAMKRLNKQCKICGLVVSGSAFNFKDEICLLCDRELATAETETMNVAATPAQADLPQRGIMAWLRRRLQGIL